MSHGSSSYNSSVKRIRGLPLIDCPDCGWEQLRLLQSTTVDNPGKFFEKCPRNEKGKKMPKDCTFFMWLEQYKQFIGELGGDAHVPTCNIAAASIEAMRVEVAGMNGRIDKLGKSVYLQLLVNCFIVLAVVLVLLVLIVK